MAMYSFSIWEKKNKKTLHIVWGLKLSINGVLFENPRFNSINKVVGPNIV